MLAPPVSRKVRECVEDALESILKTTAAANSAAWKASLPTHIEAKPFTSDRARHGLNQHCLESNEPKWGMGWTKDVRSKRVGTREVPLKDAGVGRLLSAKKAKPPVSEQDQLYSLKIEEDVKNPPMSSLPPPKAIAEAKAKAARVAAAPKPKQAASRPPAHDPPPEATEAQTRAIQIASNLKKPPETLQRLFKDNLLCWDEFKLRETYIGAHPDEEARNSILPTLYTENSLVKLMGQLAEAKDRFGDARNACDDDKIVEERATVQRLEEEVRQTVEDLRSRRQPAPPADSADSADSGKWVWKKCLRVHDGDAFGSVIGRPEVQELLLRCGLLKSPESFWWLDAEYRTPAPNSFCAIVDNPHNRGRRPPGWKQLTPARRTANFFSLRPDNGFGPLVGPKTHFQRAPERAFPDGVTNQGRTIKFGKLNSPSDIQAWDEAYDVEPESQAAFLKKRKRIEEAAEAEKAASERAEKRQKEAANAEAAEAKRAEPRLAKHVQ